MLKFCFFLLSVIFLVTWLTIFSSGQNGSAHNMPVPGGTPEERVQQSNFWSSRADSSTNAFIRNYWDKEDSRPLKPAD